MQLGIFAKTYHRLHLSEILDAVCDDGFKSVQFNMACVGLKSMPDSIPNGLPQQIALELRTRNLKMAAISGTFNMIHPDQTLKQAGLDSLALLIQHARLMGTSSITLCTGSKNANDMWHDHPENNSRVAWQELCETMQKAIQMAESAHVDLLIEPELSNVVNTTQKAKQLITEMQSQHLKVVFDPANLFEVATPKEIEYLIQEGLDLLGEHLVIVHAKDRKIDGTFAAAGLGVVPYPFLMNTLNTIGFDGDIIAHGLTEAEALPCRLFCNNNC
ncbi:MAG: sugar phosphate isomerase/epimerase [Saprospiraceae bacterium]|nr:sugar phosphate isomerase/epimerase [Saprospiraceae bacterium]